MCQLFGASSKNPIELNFYLKAFFSHSNQHPHGWGLALMNGADVQFEKEPIQASRSNYLRERLTVPVMAPVAFAHIRYATIGNVEYKNCHPFSGKDCTGRRWTLVHNGTIFDYTPANKFIHVQQGDTDSERILLYLLECINHEIKANGEMDAARRFHLIDRIVSEMAVGNKLNFLLYDGEYVYVHTNYEGSLHFFQGKNQTIFSTEPLDKEQWKPVPMTTLLAFRDGALQRTGTNHGHIYQDNEEDIKLLYQIFANL